VVGVLMVAFSLPGTEIDSFGNTVDTGSTLGFALGLLLGGIGQLVVFVAVIATGVRLGMADKR